MLLMLAAAALAPAVPSLAQKCPNLSATERVQISRPDRFEFGTQLAWYARDQCVSMAEARRRMDIQNSKAVQAVLETIERQEGANFAGVWLQHQPRYGYVVAFTRDAAATLRRYTTDPIFIPVERPGSSKLVLDKERERLSALLHRYGAKPDWSSVDIQKGLVEISYLGDLGRWNAAVARREIVVPSYLRLHGPRPLPAAPTLPVDWRRMVKHFPQARTRLGGAEPDILISGRMVLVGGCLRLARADGKPGPLLIWPAEAALEIKQGRVTVINRANGERVAPGSFRIGYLSRTPVDVADVDDLGAGCAGPFVYAGRFGAADGSR